MKSINYIILITICLTVLSCKKDTIQYTFQGVISESINMDPLASTGINIYQKPFNNSITSSFYQLAASTITNSNGIFDLTFDRIKVTEFLVAINKEGYFSHNIYLQSDEVSSAEINFVSKQLEAKSWVQFDIQNVLPSDANDDFTLILYNFREGCDECAVSDYNYFTGVVDTTFNIMSTAGQYFNFTYIDVASGNSYNDSIYMIPFDTTFYSIVY